MARASDNKKCMNFYYDWLDFIADMEPPDFKSLISSVILYAKQKTEPPKLSPEAQMAFRFMAAQIDRDRDSYDAKCEKNRENGSKGGRPRKTQITERFSKEPTKADTDKDKEKDKEKDTDKEKGYSVHFESFWSEYPRKTDKGNAYKKFNARLRDGWSAEELTEAAKAYANQTKKEYTEQRYIKQASTFLSDATPFVDYLKKKEPEEKKENTDSEDPFAKWR